MVKWLAVFSLLWFFLWSAPPSGAGSGIPLGDVELTEKESDDGRKGVSAKILMPVPPRAVWDLLSDYNRLAEVVPDLLISRVVGEEEGNQILYQQGKVRIFFYVFRGEVTLRIHEEPYEKISFAQKTGDFRYFEGDWTLRPADIGDGGEGTEVIYTLWARPKFYIPHWLLAMMLERDIPKRLKVLRERLVASHSQPIGMESREAGEP